MGICINTKSPVYKLNHSFLLENELENSDQKALITEYLNTIKENSEDTYYDFITGEELFLESFDDPDNIIEVAYLTSDINNPCYRYNNILINKKNRDRWKDRDLFIHNLTVLSKSKDWGGSYISNLLTIIFQTPIKPQVSKMELELIKKKIREGKALWWMRFRS